MTSPSKSPKCPVCPAAPGTPCISAKGHRRSVPHVVPCQHPNYILRDRDNSEAQPFCRECDEFVEL